MNKGSKKVEPEREKDVTMAAESERCYVVGFKDGGRRPGPRNENSL